MDDLGVIGAMTGVAIHDGWRPYRHYDVDHALCNAQYEEPAIMQNELAGFPFVPA
jgi:transposase